MHPSCLVARLLHGCLRAAVLALLLPVGPMLHASTNSYGLDVRAESTSAIAAEPRKSVTARFRVTNRSANARFEPRVDAPVAWRVLGGTGAFTLAEGESALRFVQLEVPPNAKAGDYRIAFKVKDAARPDMRSEAAVLVRVVAPPVEAVATSAPEALLLEVSINGRPLAGIIGAERLADGRLVLPATAWADARLRVAGPAVPMADGVEGHALDAVAGLVYKLDRSQLTLAITAPPAAFDATVLTLGDARAAAPERSPPGVYLNYDVSATRAQQRDTLYGAILEGVVFNRFGALVASGVLRNDNGPFSSVRLDTFWRSDFPERMESLVIGDTIGSGSLWSRPVRFGGVRYARDFLLAPGYITYPMPSIGGSAALPSTVDVLINNQRQSSSEVQSGPFELTNVPIVTGAGNMQVVVRDMLGRETLINQSYYVAPQLLAKGLSDFSYEAGAFRLNYGTKSDDYSKAFGAATYRRGLSDTFTGEVRGEVQRDRVAAGAGGAMVVGELGVVALAAGYSVADGLPQAYPDALVGGTPAGLPPTYTVPDRERGGHYVASAQRVTPTAGASVAYEYFDRGYQQFGSTTYEVRPKDQLVAGGGIAMGYGVNAGLNYTRRTTWDGAAFSLVGANVGIALPWRAYLTLYINKQLDGNGGTSGGVNLVVPLSENRIVAASSGRDPQGQWVDTFQVTQSVPAGPGWGWRVAVSDSESQRLQAGAAVNTNYLQVTGEANVGSDNNAVRVGANGSIGWMQGLAFASRRIDQGAFAVVQVGDLPGVPVSLSNQVVATTGEGGRALVTGLLPYQVNQLTVDPDQLPFGIEIGGVREAVVPYARSGAYVQFPVRRSRDVLVVLHQADGSVVPAGAQVVLIHGQQSFVVAKRGEVYIMDVQQENQIEVRWSGGGCTLPLALGPQVPADDIQRVGPLVCAGPR